MPKLTKNNETWMENFKGKCISCIHASPHTAKKMICKNTLGATHGLGDRGAGGGFCGVETSKLYGCVHWYPYIGKKGDEDSNKDIDGFD